MTEDEAKTKWCPFVRFVGWETFRDGEQTATANRIHHKDGSIDSYVSCLASKCMAWRPLPDSPNAVTGDIETHGFCGLAGKP